MINHNNSLTQALEMLLTTDDGAIASLFETSTILPGDNSRITLIKALVPAATGNQELALSEIIDGLEQDPNNIPLFLALVGTLKSLFRRHGLGHEFITELFGEVTYFCNKQQENNTCYMRFPKSYVDRKTLLEAASFMIFIANNLGSYFETYQMLSDAHSRSTMVRVLSFWILGGRRVKLPTNCDLYWSMKEEAFSLSVTKEVIPTGFFDTDGYQWHLDLLSLAPINYPITFYGTGASILFNFLLKQYEYNRDGVSIKAAEGDVVIDGGACWGDTALYFADRVGPEGKVYSFEFVPFNLSVIEKNLSLNPDLSGRIKVVRHAVWNVSGDQIPYHESGPGTRLDAGGNTGSWVASKSIDDFVEEGGISKVDFIKFDVEGAELHALKGAARTIQKHRPKLAICVYHKQDDFITIPQYIRSLDVGYSFYMDHFTIHTNETILFAR